MGEWKGCEFDNLHYHPPHPHTFLLSGLIMSSLLWGRSAESKQIIADHSHYQLEEVFVEKYLGYLGAFGIL